MKSALKLLSSRLTPRTLVAATATVAVGLLLSSTPATAGPKKKSGEKAAAPADRAHPLRLVRKSHDALGTSVQVIAAAGSDAEARLISAHLESAFNEIDRVDALLDDKKTDSDLMRLNLAAGRAPVRVSPEVFSVLLEARRLAEITQGAFDPTFAALAPLWRFSREDAPAPVPAPVTDGGPPTDPFVVVKATENEAPKVPPKASLKLAMSLVDFHTLQLDAAAKTAFLPTRGQRVSLGGLAKGYALERAADVLEQKGVLDFILAAGGDLVVRGRKGDEAWTVGIQDPRAPGHFAAFPATGSAVMTTGDYEHFFFDGKKRMHHVIDPRTGMPAQGLRSVTIVAKEGVVADAFSTAVLVLGPVDGMRLIERTKGVEGLLVTSKNSVKVSKGLRKKVRSRPPTDGL